MISNISAFIPGSILCIYAYLESGLSTCGLLYSKLLSRRKFFTNWPIPTFCGEKFTNHQQHLVINDFSKHFNGKIS